VEDVGVMQRRWWSATVVSVTRRREGVYPTVAEDWGVEWDGGDMDESRGARPASVAWDMVRQRLVAEVVVGNGS